MATFPATQRVVISDIEGDVTIQGWERPTIEVESDDTIERLRPQGDALYISNTEGALRLSVPHETRIVTKNISGNVNIFHVLLADVKDVEGSVVLERIQSDVSVVDSTDDITIRDINGSVGVRDAGNDLYIENINGTVQATDIGNNMRLREVRGNVTVRDIGNDLSLSNIEGTTQISSVGNDMKLREVRGNVTIRDIGNDFTLTNVEGTTQISDVGNDIELEGFRGNLRANDIGGDLQLVANLVPSRASISVGGDASVTVPGGANLTIAAIVNGDITGHSLASTSSSSHRKSATLTYGTGEAYLELRVGGDLRIQSDQSPRSSSSSSSSGGFGSGSFDFDTNGFERDMVDFEQKMGQMGRDISESVSKLNVRINDREWRLDPERLNRLVEEAKRAAADGVQGAIEAVEQALSNLRMPPPQTAPKPPVPPAPPVPPMDAATRTTPMTPVPPTETATRTMPMAPIPPIEPIKPLEPLEPMEPMGPMTPMNPLSPMEPLDSSTTDEQPAASTQLQEQSAAAPQPQEQAPSETVRSTPSTDPTQDRMAILRMIAEGRITPDEGDLLLEALGNN